MRRKWLICLVLATVTLAVYWPVRHYQFISFDDPFFVTQNPNVQAGLTWQSLRYALTASVADNWHPVTILSHILDCGLFGLNPGPMHLVNVALHIANVLLLFLILQRMTGATWRSAVVAALFALHPLRVESVAWIAERKNVLSFFFFMLTLWAYLRYVELTRPGSPARGTLSPPPASLPTTHWRSLYLGLALLCYALGLMSKPVLVTAPFLLLLLDYWPLRRVRLPVQRRELWPLLREKLGFFTLSAALCWITVRAQSQAGGIAGVNEFSLAERVSNALVSYLRYLSQFFWPARLAVFYPHPACHYPVSDQWPAWQIGAAALLLLAITAFCLLQLRSRPFLATGWFWYLGTLVPVIGLVQVGEQALADRHTYIPLIGFSVALVWLLAELATPPPRLPDLKEGGQAEEKANIRASQTAASPPAKSWFGRISFSIPGVSPRQLALAALTLLALSACLILTRRQLGYWRNSVTLFERTLEVTPDNPITQCNLGYALAEEGNLGRAAACYRAALAIRPDYVRAHFNLASLLNDQHHWSQAAEHLLAITRIEPGQYLPHALLATLLPRLGQPGQAVRHMDEALRLNPDVSPGLLNDTAWALATDPQPADRDGTNAVRLAQRACERTQYRQSAIVTTLAAAYAEAGQFQEAVAMAEWACKLAAQTSDQPSMTRNQQLLELFRAGKPYHQPAPGAKPSP